MEQNDIQTNRNTRAVNELVMAEMFLIQATLESAMAIGEGVSALSRHITQESEEEGEPVQEILQRIKDQALEPYTTRYYYFRKMISRDQ